MAATSEPRTLDEMHARIRDARARAVAAARRHEEQSLRRAVIDEEARASAAERAADAATRAADRAALDARVFAVLDPEKLAREPRKIIARVAAEHRVAPDDITGPSKRKHIVIARYAAIHAVAEEHPGLSSTQLGRIFGGRDHTTILHALGRLAPRLGSDAAAKPPEAALGPLEETLRRVADAHDVTVGQIRGRVAGGRILEARRAAIVTLGKIDPPLSSTTIGRLVHRDHTVVLTVLRRAGVRPGLNPFKTVGMSLAQARESEARAHRTARATTPTTPDSLPEQP